MWEIDDHTPFSTAGGFMRDERARSLWCVWVRSTFDLRLERSPLFRSRQLPLRQAPAFLGDDPTGPFLGDTDFTLRKPRVDLVLHALGHPPAGTSGGEAFEVGARWGGWAETLEVAPPRRWRDGRAEVEPDAAPAAVPLDWTAAWGGPDHPDNALGVGHHRDARGAEGHPLPRVGRPGATPDRPDASHEGAAFAPVARARPRRARLGGTYDAEWSRRRAPLLPLDLDPLYWQAAPEGCTLARENVSDALAKRRSITLRNMVAGVPDFSTPLPALEFEVAVRFEDVWHQVEATLETVELDLRQGLASLVHMAAFPIRAAQNDVRVDRTHVALRGADGMVVAAHDAPRFARGADLEVEGAVA